MKRSIVGTLMQLLAAAAACVGLVFYIINSKTTYFVGLGLNPLVAGSLIAAILALLLWCAFGKAKVSIADILPILAPSLCMFAFLTLLNSRVNGIAAIMTYENNAANMADLQSALVALVAMCLAAVLSCVAAFFNTRVLAK